MSWNNTEAIPLGRDCSISHFLRSRSLRNCAYPFDWNITPLSSAVRLLDNSFDDYLSAKNLVYLKPVQRLLFDEDDTALKMSDDIITPVVCQRYKMLFPHDFSAKGKEDYERVHLKYLGRCARLLKLIESSGPVSFIYSMEPLNAWQTEQYSLAGVECPETSAQDIEDLEAMLRHKYPRLRFQILTIKELKATLRPPSAFARWMNGILRRTGKTSSRPQ
ncbi:MAG TPA: DUF1796 family putative cysteine peptidase [Candidatus Acidoferrum sp.]|nr:DUF1796 family putative cysteine peptidase [Candidatus Acidoferrum sp.]